MTEVILRKRGGSLVPVDDDGIALLARLKDNRDVMAKITQPHHLRQFRLYWVIVDFVRVHAVDSHGNSLFEDRTKRGISNALKLATAWGNEYVDLNTGQRIFVPHSTSWENCEQEEFDDFFHRACDVI